jgi:signal transduction histidine kinase
MINSSLKNANILIVDDQESNLYVLEAFLTVQGYKNIKTTTDPRQVVRLFASFEPDIILLDLMMPYLSGFEVMVQLKSLISENTYLPILVLTADITSETRQHALSGGASDFVTKPFDLDEVGLRIKNLLLTSYLQQQLKNQNLILEEKVKERTSELEKKNIELIAAKEIAEASDKLKTSFINNISHEIRTPLNGILGFTEILTDPDLLPEDRAQFIHMLNSSSERLINTVTNFLDISLLASGNQKVFKKEIKLRTLMNDAFEKFKDASYDKKQILSVQIPISDNDLKIYADGDILSKILFQLIDNAIKFTNQGTITFGYKKLGNDVQFFVKDSGIGIYEENQNEIFGYFVQGNNSNNRGYEGSGLGLPIAKGFVELLGGKIWLDSERDEGSTFYFTVPLDDQFVESNGKKQIHISRINGSGKQTILIAEDDEVNFIFINILLKHDLVEVLRAKNGLEAVKACQTHPGIELVLMDLKMPEMDGFEATRQIKLHNSTLPVIAVTAYSDSQDQDKAMEAGCDEFITKPIKKEFLFKTLKQFGLPYA